MPSTGLPLRSVLETPVSVSLFSLMCLWSASPDASIAARSLEPACAFSHKTSARRR